MKTILKLAFTSIEFILFVIAILLNIAIVVLVVLAIFEIVTNPLALLVVSSFAVAIVLAASLLLFFHLICYLLDSCSKNKGYMFFNAPNNKIADNKTPNLKIDINNNAPMIGEDKYIKNISNSLVGFGGAIMSANNNETNEEKTMSGTPRKDGFMPATPTKNGENTNIISTTNKEVNSDSESPSPQDDKKIEEIKDPKFYSP